MDRIIIYGNKSMAREAYYFLKYFSDLEVVGFTVDRECMEAEKFLEVPVAPFDIVEKVFPPDSHRMLIAVGYLQNNSIRKDRYLRSKEMGYQLINFISPKATMHPETAVGDNCIIGHNTVISPAAKIGNNVFIASGCLIGHDVVIGDHCFFSPGVSVAGSVDVGSCCFLGTHATVRNKVSIGKECVIGAGAIILQDIADRSVCIGKPATKLPISSDELPLG